MNRTYSTTARIAAAIGTGFAAVVITMTGATGTASADKPCPANCHAPNPKPTIKIETAPSCGGTGQPLCPMAPLDTPPPPA